MSSSDHSFTKGFSVNSRNERSPSGAPNGSLLVNVQSRVQASLTDLLSDLFKQMDDAFFKLAESAPSNTEQNEFFEAMRELRLHSHDLESSVRKELSYQFDLLRNKQKYQPAVEPSDNDLSLVDKQRVEVDVAIGNMRTQLKTQFPDALLHLAKRLNQYLDIDWLNESNIPLGTHVLVDAFAKGMEQFELPLKIRLMVFKYFERHVIGNLQQTLSDANKILADAGMNAYIDKPRHSAGPVTQQKVPSQGAANNEFTIPFDQVQATMANSYGDSLNNRLFAAKANQFGPELKMPDLLAVLAKLQTAEAGSLQDDDPKNGRYDHQDVSLLLEHQLAHTVREKGVRKLRQVDDDVINLVSMVFEFILDDHNIPAEISLLLGRLQIPVIKVALADKTFFSNAHHPARRLLKSLSQAAIGWEKESVLQRDLLLEEIRNVVSRVLNEFDAEDIELFEQLDTSFTEFMEEENRRANTVEERVLQSAQGQAKREQATHVINQLINDRLQGKTLPTAIIDLVDGPWRTLMLQNIMRHGRDSDQWKECLATIDDLIWSIQPAQAAQERSRWVKMIPALLKKICSGLERINHPGLEVDKFLSNLWEIHGQILETPPDQPLPNSKTVDHTISQPLPASRQQLQPQGKKADFTVERVPDVEMKEADQLSPSEKQRLRAARRKQLLDPSNLAQEELRKRLLTIKPGQWIEVYTLDGRVRRCKLAFRDTQTDLYIFVSRRGNKVLETDIDSLLRMVNAEELNLLDNVSVWDRSLASVMSSLSKREDLRPMPS